MQSSRISKEAYGFNSILHLLKAFHTHKKNKKKQMEMEQIHH